MSNERRLYLSVALKLMLLVGGLVLVVTLLRSIGGTPSSPDDETNPWRLEIDWASLSPGEYREWQWPDGRRIGVYRRTADQVARLSAGDGAEPAPSAQLNPRWRSRHPEVFVFFPRESQRGCRVRPAAASGQFVEACFGARFDSTGRRLEDSGMAEQQDLSLPDYELRAGGRLRLVPPGGARG